MKTFELPVSDCGCFVAGELGDLHPPEHDGEIMKYGVVVWYRDRDTARVAAIAATQAHWD